MAEIISKSRALREFSINQKIGDNLVWQCRTWIRWTSHLAFLPAEQFEFVRHLIGKY